MDRTQYGAYLRSLRIGRGKNKEEVAHSMGIEVFMLEAWEDGELLPNAMQLKALANALQLPYEQLCPPDAPQNTPTLPKKRFRPLLIAAILFGVALTVLAMRGMNGDTPLLSGLDMQQTAASGRGIWAKESEVEAARQHILQSARFLEMGIRDTELSLLRSSSAYARRDGRLVIVTTYLFSAPDCQFQVSGYNEENVWRIDSATVTLPLE